MPLQTLFLKVMTPAIKLLKQQKIAHKIHQYQHEEANSSYGQDAAEKLAVKAEKIFKKLVVSLSNNALVVAIIPVNQTLSMKSIAKAFEVKKANMAEVDDVLRSTGYVLGGVSPLGQKKKLKTIIDTRAQAFETIYISAGRRGLEIEMSPEDLARLTQAHIMFVCSK